ncbi:dTDP-glucose 4,6-dehydratase [Candidatus Giovannonibacteria bacterium RIFCSPLOWO2_02_FULL_43_11b]|uniref:dTDP-glucose 4,6-dehydratase n=1 Tax=Candidatus Giovannonibacteria bacterium RIFCSPHIGHO2_12_FULL_43_15 TaxID=1798341 RepID=A0A1F5WP10_9BACT|nr:MAG: dTDP-glucose 4,6-dehydratase [Candidatus Giovannonibacteria bacterium RIFCSPHIGHO2_01_FULL_43_100]OGF66448.1 MAG: dTDP-glucose 4,6-dehydratase [Candidatus Giovannonibacteria bacterium RIFCSPHIGHO2_02_FULL_43_32]OGF77393.1 MAG: dTDP-glucose 4,6-dehydratase [Candidatus Giovannonibacteria bacterium RIFCSPHIGHO2_12_FULL_43_15]OGF78419.1 MAG: dTDP-glucose 4,6-dehydratase [Candidatus Giovannonibacteria bacterium RIFCSPLOWO2_01_FULL_43_60]OGF89778.1 MAG: dTDP-glucose 4,6-dehydratase [Candidatu
MKLLVTGGAGFIGSNFIRYWLNTHPEDRLINLDVLSYAGNVENLRGIKESKKYTFMKGNIGNRKLLEKVMKDVDIVVNFAAETHVDRSLEDSSVFFNNNVIAASVLYKISIKKRVKKFIQISTDEVFGELPGDGNSKFDENSRYNPQNPYSVSKAAADFLAFSYHKAYGFPIIITHSGNNYGPCQYPEKFIPLTITNALAGKNIPVYGNGKQVRNWIYVEDNVRAIEKIIIHGKIGERYCIGGEELKNIEVAEMILDRLGLGRKLIAYVRDRPGHDRKYALNCSKIKNEFGWRAKYSFKEGVAKTIEWYKNKSLKI